MQSILCEQTGVVERGMELGKKFGFPTANIPFRNDAFSGTYIGKVSVGGKDYPAAIYANQKRHLLESHLLDFSGDLYGMEITVQLFEKLETSKVFVSEQDRLEFITWAVSEVRKYFLQ